MKPLNRGKIMHDSSKMFLITHQAMVNADLDVEAIYQRLGYHAQQLEQRGEARTPHQMQASFWAAVEGITGDPDIGLHLCQYLPPYRGEILEYLMFSSRTFGSGLKRAGKYIRLISDALRINVVQNEDQLRVCLVTSNLEQPQSRHTEICITYEVLQFIASVTENSARPFSVQLKCRRISKASEYNDIFCCPVRFDAKSTEIHLDPAILDYHSPHWDPDLLRLNEGLANKRLANLERQDLIQRINTIFAQRLELHGCELESIARELDISPRRLRFELTQAGTSFSQLLTDFRYALARQLLAHSDERIENIVYLTGFSEPSTFYRAFKRWSGQTPVQYRRHAANMEPS